MRHYYYISFVAPITSQGGETYAQYGGFFYNGDKHPLHPEPFKERTEKLAKQLTILSGGIVVPAGAITFISIYQLPEEVAKERWPQDFE